MESQKTNPFSRRTADQIPLDIDQMIAQENDPKQRAFLIVLNSINNSLITNTNTTMEIGIKLEQHLDHFNLHIAGEEEMLNKGKGAWKVLAWAGGIAQLILFTIVSVGWSVIVADSRTLTTMQIADARHELRLRTNEQRLSELEEHLYDAQRQNPISKRLGPSLEEPSTPK